MQERSYSSLKRSLRFDDATASVLQRFADVAEARLGEVADAFYARIAEDGELQPLVERHGVTVLHQQLVRWLLSTLRGPFDDAFRLAQERVGSAHVRVMLPQEQMFSAMSVVRQRLLTLARELPITDPLPAVEQAVNAVSDLALALILDSYRADLVERLLSEQRQEVAEAVPAYVLALDGAGAVVLWNEQLERATGFTRAEMLGRPGRSLVDGAADARLPTRAGAPRYVRWRTVPVHTESGVIDYAFGIDVTDEREMLRRIVRAERLAAAGTLAAGLAHEIRNPLNSAMLQLQVLKRRLERRAMGTTAQDDFLPVVGTVHSELTRLEHLVSDFLAFSQPRPLVLQPVSPGDVVLGVVRAVKREASQRSVKLLTELADLGSVELEPDRVKQALENLVRNAVDAVDDGGTVTVRVRAPEGSTFDVEVEDDGPGFSEDAPIFDAFYTTKPSGTGLGLAIVHRIVTEHGGTVHTSSRPGRTVFTLRFPFDPVRTSHRGASRG